MFSTTEHTLFLYGFFCLRFKQEKDSNKLA